MSWQVINVIRVATKSILYPWFHTRRDIYTYDMCFAMSGFYNMICEKTAKFPMKQFKFGLDTVDNFYVFTTWFMFNASQNYQKKRLVTFSSSVVWELSLLLYHKWIHCLMYY